MKRTTLFLFLLCIVLTVAAVACTSVPEGTETESGTAAATEPEESTEEPTEPLPEETTAAETSPAETEPETTVEPNVISVTEGQVRVVVYSESLVRVEVSKDGGFEDRPTFAVTGRDSFMGIPAELVTSTEEGDCVYVRTPRYTVELKKDAFAKLAPVIKPEAIFVSNTSSLSITELAAASLRPEKFLGMHFFSPVPAMKLVEIIPAYDTSEDTVETGKVVAKGFGKEFVTVSDVPMFIANRVMCPMMNEAAILAGENVCSYEDIDKACELGYNLPMGPLKLADAIGIDVMINVMESLYQETADSKYRPAHLYKVLYRAGRLGRKSGKGFFDYSK